MVLLKATEFENKNAQKKRFNLSDIAAEAQAMLDGAQRECERILAQAGQQAQEIKEKARQEGYQQGQEKGLEEGRQEGHEQALGEARETFARDSVNTLKALKEICEEFNRNKERLLWQAQQETVQLALAISEKVIKQQARQNPEITIANIKEALEFITSDTNVIINVNSRDLEHLEQMAGKNEDVWGHYSHIEIKADEGITAGGCRLCTPQGQIDGQLETQIERISQELLMKEHTVTDD
ncbi:MAG: hypothetical protein JW860_16175 [Sedimentisphaerales bacterium]|nr:hypothetical protein [Sedimentisphaerales bacterium]